MGAGAIGELYLAQMGSVLSLILIFSFLAYFFSSSKCSKYSSSDHPPLYFSAIIIRAGIFFNVTLPSSGLGKLSKVHSGGVKNCTANLPVSTSNSETGAVISIFTFFSFLPKIYPANIPKA
jgi:hypothetical protein